jgi:hypothetical protein
VHSVESRTGAIVSITELTTVKCADQQASRRAGRHLFHLVDGTLDLGHEGAQGLPLVKVERDACMERGGSA